MFSLKNKKVLVVNDHAPSYFKPFQHLGFGYTNNSDIILEGDTDSVALVVFTGGSDVSPDLYGKEKHQSTHNNPGRDEEEAEVFSVAHALGIPMAGICRGAQFLCAMAGGSVIQDVTNHAGGSHSLYVRWPGKSGAQNISVTSSHHQMQYPYDLPDEHYEILGWGVSPLSKYYTLDPKVTIPSKAANNLYKSEPDVIMYHAIKALAAQYHPEWMREDTDGFLFFKAMVDHYLVPLIEERYINDGNRKEATKTAG